jgi:hypothetical protein
MLILALAAAALLAFGSAAYLLVIARVNYGSEIALSNGSELFYTSAVTEADARARHRLTPRLHNGPC